MSERLFTAGGVGLGLAECEARRLFWLDYLQALQRLNKHNDEVHNHKIQLAANRVAIAEANIRRHRAQKADAEFQAKADTEFQAEADPKSPAQVVLDISCDKITYTLWMKELEVEAAMLREEVKMYKKEDLYFNDQLERARTEVQRRRLQEDELVMTKMTLTEIQTRCKKLERRMKIMEASYTPDQLAKVHALFTALGLDA